MKIILAKNLGFCSGVKRAIFIAEKSLREDPKPLQFLGSLVHNEEVIKKFRKKGVRFIKNLREAKPGTLVIQAHGFPPLTKDININKKTLIRDATCPLVKKVQLIANNFYQNGYQVIVIGDKKHSETKGIKGWCQNQALIVENEKQAKKLPKFKKIGVVAQTTQNSDNVDRVLGILKSKTKRLKYFDTICPEVRARQKELSLILKKVDGMLIVGSRSSANTKRMVQVCQKIKVPALLVNSPEELKEKHLKKISVLGVISGTSTPSWIIEEILKKLRRRKQCPVKRIKKIRKK